MPQNPTKSQRVNLALSPSLVVERAGSQQRYSERDLATPKNRSSLVSTLASPGATVYGLCVTFKWSVKVRCQLWLLLLSAAGGTRFAFDVGGDPVDDLATCIFNRVPDSGNAQRFGSWMQACLEITAVSRVESEAMLAGRLRDALKRHRVSSDTVTQIRHKANEIRRAISAPAESAARSVAEVLGAAAADLPAGLRVPDGYRLTSEGIVRAGSGGDSNGTVICGAPMVISERWRDPLSGEQHVTVAWRVDGAWHRQVAPRETIADRKHIVQLAKYGAPITSNNANDIIAYLADFESANREPLKLSIMASQFGWQGQNGSLGFLLGATFVRSSAKAARKATGTPSSGPVVRFQGRDGGDQQLADGFVTRGDFASWGAAVKRVMKYPRVAFAMYASLTAPLLHILRIPNFCVDFSGETTGGKTTVLTLAGSLWGNADDATPGSLLRRFDGTTVWLERLPTVIRDLPVFLDESRLARKGEVVANFVYAFSTGRGRGRGTVRGLQEQATYRSVLFTTGEQPITSFSEDGGTRPRVMSLWGTPFGKKSPEIGTLIADVLAVVREHHGHAGRQWIEYLAAHRGEWKKWRQRHRKLRKDFERQATNVYARRQAPAWAAIRLAAELVHGGLKLPWRPFDPVTPLIGVLSREAKGADRALEALRVAYDYFTTNMPRFFGCHDGERTPTQWLGTYRVITLPGVAVEDDKEASGAHRVPWPNEIREIGFVPTELRSKLASVDFDVEAVLRSWRDRGWIHKGADATRLTVKRRIEGVNVNMLVLTTKALGELKV